MSQLWIRRHAPTAWNQDKRLQGHEDIPLLPESLSALSEQRLEPRWRGLPCFSSPLLRCVQTATALGYEPELVPALIEMDWGRWSGQRLSELRLQEAEPMQRLERQGRDFCPPEGESPRQVAQRVLVWLRATELAPCSVLISHKGVIRALLAEATGWPMLEPFPTPLHWQDWFGFQWQAERLVFLGQRPPEGF